MNYCLFHSAMGPVNYKGIEDKEVLHGPSMLPNKAKSVVCFIIGLALSFWMKHLVIGQLQKPAKFSAFHWSTSRSQAFIGQLLGTSRVVHIPKQALMVLFTISDA